MSKMAYLQLCLAVILITTLLNLSGIGPSLHSSGSSRSWSSGDWGDSGGWSDSGGGGHK